MSNCEYWINHEKKIVLIYSCKCACTSLHNAFIREICNIDKELDPRDPRIIANKEKLTSSNFDNIPQDYTIYWGIRNPYDRIVSCFFNKFVLYSHRRLNKDNLEGFSKQLLKQINVNYNDLTFIKMLNGIKQRISKNKPLNAHFNTQVNIENYNKIKNHPNLVLFDINNIPDVFKINYKLNMTKIPENIVSENLCNVNAKDININSLLKKNLIESKELVKEVYKQDYEIFEKFNFIYE